MTFDPETYSLSIRKECIDDEIYFVGRVDEFPNISCFEDSFETAHKKLINAISALHKIAEEEGVPFPLPRPALDGEYSGRVTLRIPKSLHAKLDKMARAEDVSLNQLMVTGLATYAGEADGLSRAAKVMADTVINAAKNAAFYIAAKVSETMPTPVSSSVTIPRLANEHVLSGSLIGRSYYSAPSVSGL